MKYEIKNDSVDPNDADTYHDREHPEDSMRPYYPKVHIVILNWDGQEVLRECIDSIEKMEYTNYEIIVVDNGSSDGSQNMVRDVFPSAHMIINKTNVGVAEGQNIGMRYAVNCGAEYILITNNDVTFDKRCLTELMEVAESDNRIGIIGPKIYYSEMPNKIWQAGRYLNWNKGTCIIEGNEIDIGQYDEQKEVDFLGVILIRKNVLEKIGLYQANFFAYWEDTDFCVRAHKAGFKIVYAPKAKIWHKVSYTTKRIKGFFEYFSTRNRFWFMKSHATNRQYLLFLSYFFGYHFWLLSASHILYHKDPNAFRSFLWGIIDGLKNAP